MEFIVVGIVPEEMGRTTVIGRNGDRPIRLNDTFDSIVKYKRPVTLEDYGNDPVVLEEKPVLIRVVCIHAYERSLAELGEGMAGSLVIEGQGSRSVAPGWVLLKRDDFDATMVDAASSALTATKNEVSTRE